MAAFAGKSLKMIYRKAKEQAQEALSYGPNAGAPSAMVEDGVAVFKDFEGEQFFRCFTLKEVLRQGSFAKVFKATIKKAPKGSKPFAIKRIGRWGLKEKDKRAISREVLILSSLDHPNVMKIYQFYPNDLRYFFMVLEYMEGGELFDNIVQRTSFQEKDVRDVCKTLVGALKCCHDQSIVHRDLKPSNILLSSTKSDGVLKLADFGLACSVFNGLVTTDCGTPEFTAPEILLGKPHGTSVDMWVIGLICAILISGEHPFYQSNTTKMFIKVAAGDYDFSSKRWKHTSEEAQDFISKLLIVDQFKRMTAEEAVSHPWLVATNQTLAKNDLEHGLDHLKLYNAKRNFRAMVKTYLAGRKMFSSLAPGHFSKAFVIGDKLGEGAFATVFKAVAVGDRLGTSYAVKRIDRKNLSTEDKQSTIDEAKILFDLQHPNVVKIYNFYENDPKYYYIVLEFIAGGELFDRIVQKTFYNEEEARDLSRILLGGMNYVHKQGIVHRDLKPENLLLSSSADDTSVRIADFGFACSVLDGPVTLQCGTPAYIAPEILKGMPYATSVDMWSLGVIIYVILAGQLPFSDTNQTRMFRRIKAGHFKFDKKLWRGVSAEAKDLVRRLLIVDPGKRLTASEAIQHPWLLTQGKNLASNDLGSGLEKMRVFNATRKLRAAIKSVVAAKRLASGLGRHC